MTAGLIVVAILALIVVREQRLYRRQQRFITQRRLADAMDEHRRFVEALRRMEDA